MAGKKVGIWLIGARGSIATTVALGLGGLRREMIDATGLVSALPDFASLELVPWDDLILGGHEIRDVRLADEAARMHRESRIFSADVLAACQDELEATDANIRQGTLFRVGSTIEKLATDTKSAARSLPADETPRAIIERLQNDLVSFAAAHELGRIVVVNVASTEPAVDLDTIPPRWAEVAASLDDPETCRLPASSLYAIAALDLGYPYINFTPSLGAVPLAIDELARNRKACHAGSDGKTGETLMKSVLAPMFARRNLEVMSWVGHNIFGNLDGRVLDDPVNKAAKVASKDKLLGDILGRQPSSLVSIEYIESLADWKTAWDHIHFRGFLDTPMTLQFTWHGCDSLLAAPLVLDLVRFAEIAAQRGEIGALGFLASFFKSPLGAKEVCFDRQFQTLLDWAGASCG